MDTDFKCSLILRKSSCPKSGMGMLAVMMFTFILCLLALGSLQGYGFRSQRRIARQRETEAALALTSGLAYLQELRANGVPLSEKGGRLVWPASSGNVTISLRAGAKSHSPVPGKITELYTISLSGWDHLPLPERSLIAGIYIDDAEGKHVERLQVMEGNK